MKKIIILILFIIVLSGCYKNKGNVKEKINDSKIKNIVTKKYYSYIVKAYDHDDYDINVKNSSLNVNNLDYKVNSNLSNESNTLDDIDISAINNYEEKSEDEKQKDKEERENEILEKEETINGTNDKIDEKNVEDLKDKISEEIKDDSEKSQSPTLDEKKEELIKDKKEELTDNNEKVTAGYYSPSGKYLGTTNVKVIDVSYYQGDINWDLFAKESDCYGVILRLGYYTTLDKKFESYIKEIKRLNIPYGIYLFSYSTTSNGALKEANFVNSAIDKYNLSPNLGIFYDIESWSSKNSNSNDISKNMYDNIVQIFINKVSSHINYRYKVKVYSGRWYAMNRLGSIAKSYVDWVAEYNKTCKYDSVYSLWQYTSRARVPGINTYVDVSYILN